MNLENVDEKIQLLHDKIFRQEKTEKRLALIKLHLELLYNDLTIHKSKMDKEHQDVLNLEKTSTISLFRNILGNQEEQLEKERQEYLQVVLEYNSIANQIDLLLYEQEVLNKEPLKIDSIRSQLNDLLQLKEQILLPQNVSQTTQIKEINGEIDRLQSFTRELKEAKALADVVEKVLSRTFSNLKKVAEFQLSNLRGPSGHSSYAMKSYIDEAVKGASEINFYLGKLDKELSEVYSQYTFFNIYKYQNFVDSFYDQLITDWVLKSKLKNAISCLQSAENQIKRILATLNNDLSKTEKLMKAQMDKKREIVRNI